jgi:hypothetical protein
VKSFLLLSVVVAAIITLLSIKHSLQVVGMVAVPALVWAAVEVEQQIFAEEPR